MKFLIIFALIVHQSRAAMVVDVAQIAEEQHQKPSLSESFNQQQQHHHHQQQQQQQQQHHQQSYEPSVEQSHWHEQQQHQANKDYAQQHVIVVPKPQSQDKGIVTHVTVQRVPQRTMPTVESRNRQKSPDEKLPQIGVQVSHVSDYQHQFPHVGVHVSQMAADGSYVEVPQQYPVLVPQIIPVQAQQKSHVDDVDEAQWQMQKPPVGAGIVGVQFVPETGHQHVGQQNEHAHNQQLPSYVQLVLDGVHQQHPQYIIAGQQQHRPFVTVPIVQVPVNQAAHQQYQQQQQHQHQQQHQQTEEGGHFGGSSVSSQHVVQQPAGHHVTKYGGSGSQQQDYQSEQHQQHPNVVSHIILPLIGQQSSSGGGGVGSHGGDGHGGGYGGGHVGVGSGGVYGEAVAGQHHYQQGVPSHVQIVSNQHHPQSAAHISSLYPNSGHFVVQHQPHEVPHVRVIDSGEINQQQQHSHEHDYQAVSHNHQQQQQPHIIYVHAPQQPAKEAQQQFEHSQQHFTQATHAPAHNHD